jgi:transcription initiation factor IIE alpha subunit
MSAILQYLKSHGEKLDTEIAEATGLSVEAIRIQLIELSANNEVMVCQSTRYVKGNKIESVSCRISGFIPKAAPGRKSARVNLKLS